MIIDGREGNIHSGGRSLGASEERARTTAYVLVAADLRGISSHGVAGGTGLTEIVERTRAGASMNEKGGLGPSAAMEAAHLAGDLAGQYGAGRVHVYEANHFGVACVYVEALLERGLAARCTSTSGAWMIPYENSQWETLHLLSEKSGDPHRIPRVRPARRH